MIKRHPRNLFIGNQNTVIALSDTEVGKLFTGDNPLGHWLGDGKMKFNIFLGEKGIRIIDVSILALDLFKIAEKY